MTLALGLLCGAVLIGVGAPCYLRRVVNPRVRPGVALTGWITSLIACVVTTVAGGALLLAPHNATADGVIGMTANCLNAEPESRLVETMWRLTGAVVVFALLVRVLVVAVSVLRRERNFRRDHLFAVRTLTRAEPGARVLWIDQAVPIAYSLGGPDGSIVATTGVSRLSTPQREAILEHEHAHLRGRHHALVLFVRILDGALPFVPLFRAAEPTVRVLVELAADASAARCCGVGPVRAALRAVIGQSVPVASLAMSRESVELRLRWLGSAWAPAGSLPRQRAIYTATAFASAVPAAVAIGAVAGLAVLYCLGVSTV